MTALKQTVPTMQPLVRLGTQSMRAALPVKGPDHTANAFAANYLLGKGAALVVAGYGGTLAAGSTYDFRYWVWPDSRHVTRMWMIQLAAWIDGTYFIVKTSSARSRGVVTVGGNNYPYDVGPVPQTLYIPYDSADGNTPAEAMFSVTPDAGYDPLVVKSSGLYDAPRASFSGTDGVIESSCNTRQPIYYDNVDPKSLMAVWGQTIVAAVNVVRRGAMFSYCSGDCPTFGVNGYATSSTSYVDFFSVKPSLQTRLMYQGETTRTVKVNVLASCGSLGGGGAVKATMTNGASISWTGITSSSLVWLGEKDLAVNTDDPTRFTTDGGLRGAARDELHVEFKSGSVSDNMHIKAICIADPWGP